MEMSQEKIEKALDKEQEEFMRRTKTSYRHLAQSSSILPLGVASSFQSHYPYPFVIKESFGSWVRDIDHNLYLDLHAGFGVNIISHNHVKIREVLQNWTTGLHYGAPHQNLIFFVQDLAQRFSLDQLRLTNSGTEATMEAIKLARAYTGKDFIVKMEGAYHGHHDSVMMSVKPDLKQVKNLPNATPASQGIPQDVAKHTLVLSPNNISSLQQLFEKRGDKIAAIIMEPVMFNLGFVRITEEYMNMVRSLCDKYGVILIWDEVKTGLTVSYHGSEDLYSVTPDLKCLGKTIGGGLPVGAVGGKQEIMELISKDLSPHYGTFSGNPLVSELGRVVLDLLDSESYQHIEQYNQEIRKTMQADIEEYGLPLHIDTQGFKGGIMFSSESPTNYREWSKNTNAYLSQLAWIFFANNGVWMSPGADEQWTLKLDWSEEEQELLLEVWENWKNYLLHLQ